jgi:hypothetical protein
VKRTFRDIAGPDLFQRDPPADLTRQRKASADALKIDLILHIASLREVTWLNKHKASSTSEGDQAITQRG